MPSRRCRRFDQSESRRGQIADPMQRAGALNEYPNLFGALCRLLCHAGRAAELLGAMEGAKGRVLADVLTKQRGEVIPDSEFLEPADELARVLQATNAHYLSYFVNDDETYAVLVARDGSIRCQTIAVGKEQLRGLVESADPKTWSRARGGIFSAPTPARLPDQLRHEPVLLLLESIYHRQHFPAAELLRRLNHEPLIPREIFDREDPIRRLGEE